MECLASIVLTLDIFFLLYIAQSSWRDKRRYRDAWWNKDKLKEWQFIWWGKKGLRWGIQWGCYQNIYKYYHLGPIQIRHHYIKSGFGG